MLVSPGTDHNAFARASDSQTIQPDLPGYRDEASSQINRNKQPIKQLWFSAERKVHAGNRDSYICLTNECKVSVFFLIKTWKKPNENIECSTTWSPAVIEDQKCSINSTEVADNTVKLKKPAGI